MLKKRITSIFLSILIVIGVVASDYCTVMAADIPTAFWGTLEASRAWFTAMQTGGAFDRGISYEDFIATDDVDWTNLAARIMIAYQIFCIEKEKVRIALENPDMPFSEVSELATSSGEKMCDDFKKNAINVSGTTGTITKKDFKYWQEFCKTVSSVAKNGIGSGSISPETIISPKVVNSSDVLINNVLTNVGANTFDYDGKSYIYKGKYRGTDYEVTNSATDRVRMIYASIRLEDSTRGWIYADLYSFDVNRLTKEVISGSLRKIVGDLLAFSDADKVNIYREFAENTNFPMYITDRQTDQMKNDYISNYQNNLPVSIGTSASESETAIDDALKGKAGQAVKDGNTKQSTKTVVKEGSVPVKRSSLKEEERNGEKVVSGDIGWDIPRTEVITAPIVDDTKEDEFIEDIGVIDVPEDIIIDDPVPGEIVIPGEEEVVIPVTPDLPIPIIKLLEIQYGPFYPTSMDITEFFPFCIPFDFAYCINKFRVGEGEAPTIDFPIVYPKKLQPILGESYHVIIDFNDYIFLRNIIRYFLLLSFITGLMFATRSLIRG